MDFVFLRCLLVLAPDQEEVEEEVVDYEPWMDDHGRVPNGVEFDADDQLCSLHPEVWLKAGAVQEVRDEADRARREADEAQARKREAKKNRARQREAAAAVARDAPPPPAAAAAGAKPSTKKGIANKKSRALQQQQQQQQLQDQQLLLQPQDAASSGNNNELDMVDILNDDAEFDLDNADFLDMEEFENENFDDLGMDFGE
jgi:hypothetical protein